MPGIHRHHRDGSHFCLFLLSNRYEPSGLGRCCVFRSNLQEERRRFTRFQALPLRTLEQYSHCAETAEKRQLLRNGAGAGLERWGPWCWILPPSLGGGASWFPPHLCEQMKSILFVHVLRPPEDKSASASTPRHLCSFGASAVSRHHFAWNFCRKYLMFPFSHRWCDLHGDHARLRAELKSV